VAAPVSKRPSFQAPHNVGMRQSNHRHYSASALYQIRRAVVRLEEFEVEFGILKERVDNMQKVQNQLADKFDRLMFWLVMTFGGVTVSVILLLFKK
jgi:hypothetical protein